MRFLHLLRHHYRYTLLSQTHTHPSLHKYYINLQIYLRYITKPQHHHNKMSHFKDRTVSNNEREFLLASIRDCMFAGSFYYSQI